MKTTGIAGLLALVATLLLPSSFPTITPANAATYQTHPRISIVGNGEFTTANGVTQGSGTSSDPYLIEGWNISAYGRPGVCCNSGIEIQNTTSSFVIRSVLVQSGGINFGIRLARVSHGLIEDSIVKASDPAIIAENSANVSIVHNTVVSPQAWGIYLWYSKNSIVSSNTVTSSSVWGIYFDHSNNTLVTRNTLSNDHIGIELDNSVHNIIVANDISSNSLSGIRTWVSSWNQFYHNNLIGNNENALQFSGDTNSWNSNYPDGGNYWSDYAGQDKCNGPAQDVCTGPDGIGDSPYNSASGQYFPSLTDRYPLMQPYNIQSNLSPDIMMIVDPSSLVLTAGSPGRITLSLRSINDFDDTVSIHATTDSREFAISVSPSLVRLYARSVMNSTIVVSTSDGIKTGTYLIDFTVTSSSISRTRQLHLTVTPKTGTPANQPSPMPSPATILGQSPTMILGIAGATAIVLVGVAASLLVKRRRT